MGTAGTLKLRSVDSSYIVNIARIAHLNSIFPFSVDLALIYEDPILQTAKSACGQVLYALNFPRNWSSLISISQEFGSTQRLAGLASKVIYEVYNLAMCAWIKNLFFFSYVFGEQPSHHFYIYKYREGFFCSQPVTSSEPQFSEQPASIFHSTRKMTFLQEGNESCCKHVFSVVVFCIIQLYWDLFSSLLCSFGCYPYFISYAFLMFCKERKKICKIARCLFSLQKNHKCLLLHFADRKSVV